MTRKVGIEYIKIPFRGETLNEGNLPEPHRQRTQPRRRPAGEAGTQPRRNRRRKREKSVSGQCVREKKPDLRTQLERVTTKWAGKSLNGLNHGNNAQKRPKCARVGCFRRWFANLQPARYIAVPPGKGRDTLKRRGEL